MKCEIILEGNWDFKVWCDEIREFSYTNSDGQPYVFNTAGTVGFYNGGDTFLPIENPRIKITFDKG
jgi:hypothetical protein